MTIETVEPTTQRFDLEYVDQLEAHLNARGKYDEEKVVRGLIKMVQGAAVRSEALVEALKHERIKLAEDKLIIISADRRSDLRKYEARVTTLRTALETYLRRTGIGYSADKEADGLRAALEESK